MTLRELKAWVNNISEEDLDKPLGYQSENYCISGFVEDIIQVEEDYYWLEDDDPSDLYTREELLQDYDEEEIDKFMIEIHKGDPVIRF